MRTDLFEPVPKRLLHIAPEAAFLRRFQMEKHIDYVTADLYDPDVLVKMDITDIPFQDDSFDVIYCSHVLEHVQEDRKAMRELCRVLKPGGWAALMVPFALQEETFEDPAVTDPKERKRLFWQHDHVRLYGLDFEDRLAEEGFAVQKFKAPEVVGADGIERMMIWEEDAVFYCTKRANGSPKSF